MELCNYPMHSFSLEINDLMSMFRSALAEFKGNISKMSDWMFTGDQYCGGRLVKPSGTFKTPNWPDKDYPAGVTCSWHIVAPKNQVQLI